MAVPGPAIAAVAAGNVAFTGDPVAYGEPRNVAADLHDLAHVLVAYCHRHTDRVLRPLVPVVDMDVRPADRGLANTNLYVVGPRDGLRLIFHPDAGFGLSLYECLHAMTFISRPTFANAATALSI